MDVALLVAAGIAVACIVFALVFMPRRAGDRRKGRNGKKGHVEASTQTK